MCVLASGSAGGAGATTTRTSDSRAKSTSGETFEFLRQPGRVADDFADLAHREIARETAQAAGDDQIALFGLLALHQVFDGAAVAILAGLAAQNAATAGARQHHVDGRAGIDGEQDVRGFARDAVDPTHHAVGRDDGHPPADQAFAAVELDARHAEVGRDVDGDHPRHQGFGGDGVAQAEQPLEAHALGGAALGLEQLGAQAAVLVAQGFVLGAHVHEIHVAGRRRDRCCGPGGPSATARA